MKKLFAALLAALLCVCLCASALAETGATLVRTYNGGTPSLISDTNRYHNNYAMTDIELNPLTEEHYYSFLHEDGWITASDMNAADTINNDGVFDVNGNIIVPFEYADLKVHNHDWIVGIKLSAGTSENYDYSANNKTEFFVITGADVYYTPTGKIASLTRDQYLDSAVNKDHLAVQDRATGVITLYDSTFTAVETLKSLYATPEKALPKIGTFRLDGRYGLKDGQGNIILDAIYRSIYVSEKYPEYATFEKTDANEIRRTGLLSTTDGTVIIPAAYDSIKVAYTLPTNEQGVYGGYNAHGYFTVVLDNKVGFVDINGVETVAPKYSSEIATLNGASYSLTDLTGATLIVAADGVETSVSGYKKVTALNYCSGIFYQVETNDGLRGVIDWHGNEILPAVYEYSIKATGDGKYLLVSPDYKSSELYELTYPSAATAAPAATEVPAAPEAPAAADHPAATLLNTAITLLSADAASNGVAVSGIITSASALIGTANPAVTALLDSANSLLGLDPAANAATVITLLTTALGML